LLQTQEQYLTFLNEVLYRIRNKLIILS
jgi:hypothetical protein